MQLSSLKIIVNSSGLFEEDGIANMQYWKLTAIILSFLFAIPAFGQTGTPEEAMALEKQGKLEEAVKVWRTVIQQNPRHAAAYASLGVILSKLQKFDEAAIAYKKALALNPNLPPGIQLNLGLAEFKQGHFKSAIAPFSIVLAADPQNQQARILLGFCFYGAMQYAEAVKYLEPSSKLDPANMELHKVLAQSCLWAKNRACAENEFRLILKQDPNSAAAHIFLGQALDQVGRTSEALSEFQEAAQIAPHEPNLHFGLGFLHLKLNQYEDAKKELGIELSLDPTNAQALAYLGDIALKQSHPEEAVSLLKKSIQLKSDLRFAHLCLGNALTKLKRYQEAAIALQRAIALDPSEPDAHYQLGRVYRALGDTAASQKEFDKVRGLRQKVDEDLIHKMSSAPPAINP